MKAEEKEQEACKAGQELCVLLQSRDMRRHQDLLPRSVQPVFNPWKGSTAFSASVEEEDSALWGRSQSGCEHTA